MEPLYENDSYRTVTSAISFYYVQRKRDNRMVAGPFEANTEARAWIKRQEATHAAARHARYVKTEYL